MKKNKPDLVELLEDEDGNLVEESVVTPWLGHHEPDYSLTPDRVIPLDKNKYPGYNEALLRFAEIAKNQKLRLHKYIETARHHVFEVFFLVEDDNEQEG